MTIEFATWDSIHDWAQQEGFLAHFGKTSKFSLFSRPRITLKEGRVIDGHHVPGLEALKTMTINPQASVYAWIETDGSVKLRPLEWGDMAVHEGLTSPPTSFAQPFCWVLPIQNETGMRFESLVQYYTRLGFVNGPGIRTGIAALKEHFPGACHDMAKQIDAEAARRTISARAFPLSSQLEPIPQSPASVITDFQSYHLRPSKPSRRLPKHSHRRRTSCESKCVPSIAELLLQKRSVTGSKKTPPRLKRTRERLKKERHVQRRKRRRVRNSTRR